MKQTESAGIITYTIDDKTINYLLLHYEGGHWDFPKGKIETGETKKEAALRELKEETGLTATLADNFEEKLSYIFTDIYTTQEKTLTKKTVYFFIGKAHSTDVHLSHEHIGYKWLPFNEALKQVTYKNAKEILTKVNHFLLTHKD